MAVEGAGQGRIEVMAKGADTAVGAPRSLLALDLVGEPPRGAGAR